jgi:hypothetical protein
MRWVYEVNVGGTRFGLTIEPHPVALVVAVLLFLVDKPYSAALALACNGNVFIA